MLWMKNCSSPGGPGTDGGGTWGGGCDSLMAAILGASGAPSVADHRATRLPFANTSGQIPASSGLHKLRGVCSKSEQKQQETVRN
jgi:hypothetical protein